jgi:hypothetical protein
MLLTSLIRKHMYSYISENNFGSSKQILVPTGYMCFVSASCLFNILIDIYYFVTLTQQYLKYWNVFYVNLFNINKKFMENKT